MLCVCICVMLCVFICEYIVYIRYIISYILVTSAQCYVYAQDPTNLFRPHKSFIRPQEKQTEKQTEIICREKTKYFPPLHPTFADCFCALTSQKALFPFFRILPDAEKAPLINIPE